MKTLPTLPALYKGNLLVIGGFSSEGDSNAEICFVIVSLNKLLNKKCVVDFRRFDAHTFIYNLVCV